MRLMGLPLRHLSYSDMNFDFDFDFDFDSEFGSFLNSVLCWTMIKAKVKCNSFQKNRVEDVYDKSREERNQPDP